MSSGADVASKSIETMRRSPAFRASTASWASAKAVIMTMGSSGNFLWTERSRVMPSMPGRRKSVSTML